MDDFARIVKQITSSRDGYIRKLVETGSRDEAFEWLYYTFNTTGEDADTDLIGMIDVEFFCKEGLDHIYKYGKDWRKHRRVEDEPPGGTVFIVEGDGLY